MSQSRKAQRRAAVFLLYQRDLTGAELDSLLEGYRRDHGEAAPEYVVGLVEGAWRDRARLDELIDRSARGWTAERMAVLERNVLRLGLHELLSGEVPAPVAIDEAVSLAKRYASPEAASLVNGILGKVARTEGVGR
jgi:transcription antitermination protein NusB